MTISLLHDASSLAELTARLRADYERVGLRVRCLDDARDFVHSFICELNPGIDFRCDFDFDRVITLVCDQVQDLAPLGFDSSALPHYFDHSLDCVDVLDFDLAHVHALVRDLDGSRQVGFLFDLARALERAFGTANSCHEELAGLLRRADVTAHGPRDRVRTEPGRDVSGESGDIDQPREQREVMMAGVAVRAVAWAVLILPAAARPRYAEEFRSELWEQAELGASRLHQWYHAVRLLIGAPQLRGELKASRGRRAVT